VTESIGEFEEARHGLIAPFDPARIEDEDGRVVWELEFYDFLDSEPPPASANPRSTIAYTPEGGKAIKRRKTVVLKEKLRG
jgi:hypothetical protein